MTLKGKVQEDCGTTVYVQGVSTSHLLLLPEMAALCSLTARGINEFLSLSVWHLSERNLELPELLSGERRVQQQEDGTETVTGGHPSGV